MKASPNISKPKKEVIQVLLTAFFIGLWYRGWARLSPGSLNYHWKCPQNPTRIVSIMKMKASHYNCFQGVLMTVFIGSLFRGRVKRLPGPLNYLWKYPKTLAPLLTSSIVKGQKVDPPEIDLSFLSLF